MGFSWIDAIIVVLVAFSIYRGTQKGLVKTVFSLAAIFIGYNIARQSMGFVSSYWGDSLVLKITVFCAVFLITAFLINFLGQILHFITKIIFMGPANTLGGVFVGLLQGMVLCSILLFSVTLVDREKPQAVSHSFFAKPLMDTLNKMSFEIPNMRESVNEGIDKIKKLDGAFKK
jgi:membrane protein required for colicin V production